MGIGTGGATAARWRGGVIILLVLMLLPVRAGATSTASEELWQDFLADRTELYNKLAPPFVECFQRRDSAIDPLSPIFHGCLDWHSAVHAAYSHVAIYNHTGAYAFRQLVEQQAFPQGVSLVPAEQAYQQAKGADLPLTENPYGFGWFLVLAREWKLATGRDDFKAMADYAASMMQNWFQTRLTNGDSRSFILNNAHSNYSWSLINLDSWAKFTNNQALQADVYRYGQPLLDGSLDTSCGANKDRVGNAGGFQPTCLMRITAVSQIWGAERNEWVAARIPATYHIPPVTAPGSCHAGGQNFLRAFALYKLHLATGRTDLRDNYVELVRYHVGRPDLYIDPSYTSTPGYMCYSHWVAQLGVRAITLSYESPSQVPAPATP
jgi:hypothetical protein